MTLPRTALALVLVAILTTGAWAQSAGGIPLPRGTRAADPASSEPLFVSGRGFRDTVEHVRKQLQRRGIDHEAVPIYRRRGISIARFIARSPSAPFLAIHVFHAGARTLIFVVPPRP
ncbi:MAG TPA: hypothetical protein VMZ28_17095 [Kofleriaceae bacterium]|nr:hypothetical protein [Kofleriaceae bacterium]